MVKEFLKSANIWQNMNAKYSWSFLTHSVDGILRTVSEFTVNATY